MKRKIYKEVGGFDETYFMYGEDIDLSYKIHKKGYQNYYFSDTQIIHYKGESTKKDIKYLRHFYGAIKIFYRKHFKLNKIYDTVMSLGIHFWYFMKFFKIKTTKATDPSITKFIYIGENQKTFTKLKQKLNAKLAVNHTQISINDIKATQVDTVFFDNNYISNKAIISGMHTLKDSNISFRFIPKNCTFFIGSDSAIDRGIIEQL
ncbi:MAG: hypothetical protein L3J74_14590 [Bacteroidales bacterium]|nr:hypothetical protein [Bacteroidales bacterium]